MTAPQRQETIITEEQHGQRLDTLLTELSGGASRSSVQRTIRDGHVQVNGRPPKSTHQFLKTEDRITFDPSAFNLSTGPKVPQPRPDIEVPVVYEDEDLLIVNKPSGLLVHATVHDEEETLAAALLARYPELNGIGEGPERPGIVHRLDRDASGLLAVARNQPAFEQLKQIFKQHDIEKEYMVLVQGRPPEDEGTIEQPIGRSVGERRMAAHSQSRPGDREAVTHYRVEEELFQTTLLSVRTETGRTHQIRVHLKSIGCPVVGDPLYSHKRSGLPDGRLFLHATRLAFRHPISGEPLEFTSPLPPELEQSLERRRKNKK